MDDSAKLLLGLLIGGAVTHVVYASGQSSSSREPSMAGHAATRPRRRRPPSATVPPVLVEAMREVNGLAAQIARQEVEKHVAHAAAASVLVVHLRTKATLSTLSWALWLIAHLADTHGYQLSRACHLPADGSGLLDYSRILTLVLSRGV